MAHDVFISYSHHDKAIADAVCATLEGAGIRCWIAPRDVSPGENWGASIIRAINGSRCMILILSGSSNLSVQVRKEVERAASKGIAILPFRIEAVAPSEHLELFIMEHHWLDALTPPLDRYLKDLAGAVTSLITLAQPPELVRDEGQSGILRLVRRGPWRGKFVDSTDCFCV